MRPAGGLLGLALLLGCSGSNFTAADAKGGGAGASSAGSGQGGGAGSGEPQGGAGMASGGSPAGQGGMAAGSAGSAAGGPATGGAGTGGESAAGGLGGAGAGQGGGAGGPATGGAAGAGFPCDVQEALRESCARAGCHTAADRMSGLDLSKMDRIAEQMVDVHATHGDIACNAPGEPFRACTQEELTGCSWGAYRVDSQNFNDSWVVAKLMGNQGQCGGQMPQPPGNSEENGWSPERRACLLAYFQSLTR